MAEENREIHEIDRLMGVGVDYERESAVIVWNTKSNRQMRVPVHLEDLTELIFALSHAATKLQAQQSESHHLRYTLPVETAQFLTRLDSGELALILKLNTGVDLSFSIPDEQCQNLLRSLRSML